MNGSSVSPNWVRTLLGVALVAVCVTGLLAELVSALGYYADPWLPTTPPPAAMVQNISQNVLAAALPSTQVKSRLPGEVRQARLRLLRSVPAGEWNLENEFGSYTWPPDLVPGWHSVVDDVWVRLAPSGWPGAWLAFMNGGRPAGATTSSIAQRLASDLLAPSLERDYTSALPAYVSHGVASAQQVFVEYLGVSGCGDRVVCEGTGHFARFVVIYR